METVPQPHLSQGSAMSALTSAFLRWNPQSIFDIAPTDKATLDLLFANPPFVINTADSTVDTNSDAPIYDDVFKKTIQQLQEKVGALVRNFNTALSSGTLSIEELQSACTAVESSSWDSYKIYCDRERTANAAALYRYTHSMHRLALLPSVSSITNEIDSMQQLKQTIKQFSCVSIQEKSFSLGDYTFQHFPNGKVDLTEKFCTSTLRQQHKSIQSVIGTDPDFLYWYAYFKNHTSILLPSDAVTPPVPNRSFNLNESYQRIKDAFGPSMNYSGVCTAMQLLSNVNDYETEMKLLLNCRILKLSAFDVTHFRAVKILHEITKPLQIFIQCCALHHFKVVDSDPSFRVLQTMVNDFYSSESHDRQSCIQYIMYC